MIEDAGFLGRGWSFPLTFSGDNGAAEMVQKEQDIEQSLRILMATRPGERVMHPTYGCRLHDFVFEPITPATCRAIETTVRKSIMFFEARIKLQQVSARSTDALEGRLDILLDYVIAETNSRHNVVFPFYIKEGTLVSDQPAAVT